MQLAGRDPQYSQLGTQAFSRLSWQVHSCNELTGLELTRLLIYAIDMDEGIYAHAWGVWVAAMNMKDSLMYM